MQSSAPSYSCNEIKFYSSRWPSGLPITISSLNILWYVFKNYFEVCCRRFAFVISVCLYSAHVCFVFTDVSIHDQLVFLSCKWVSGNENVVYNIALTENRLHLVTVSFATIMQEPMKSWGVWVACTIIQFWWHSQTFVGKFHFRSYKISTLRNNGVYIQWRSY